jgi:hypothetical protein
MEGLYQAQILGRKRDIYFGMPAIEYVYEKIEPEAFTRLSSGSFQTTDVKLIAHFVFAGIKGGCELNDEREDVAFRDVYQEVEKMLLHGDEHKVIEAVGKAFSQSNTIKGMIQKKSKKKLSPSTSQKSGA